MVEFKFGDLRMLSTIDTFALIKNWLVFNLVVFIKITKSNNSVQCKPLQSNLDYLNPRLSELRAKQKVLVKVQISVTILICTCAVECTTTIIRYARANDSL